MGPLTTVLYEFQTMRIFEFGTVICEYDRKNLLEQFKSEDVGQFVELAQYGCL